MKYLLSIFLFLHLANAEAQVIINEICAANGDVIKDDQFLNFSSWVELHNTAASPVNISGYYLSNDENNITLWSVPAGTTIPSKGYVLIWCDERNSGLHTNFSLRTKGEKLILTTAALLPADMITFPQQFTNLSYGRMNAETETFAYSSTPSPLFANTTAKGTTLCENPQFSLKAGRYSGSQTVTITSSLPGTTIRYTTDGSDPTPGSAIFSGSLVVSKTLTLKAKSFHPDFLPSKTEVKTYFINEPVFTLPVVSVSIKPDYLWDNHYGIYTDGQNGTWGNCVSSPKNWNQDWDRHASFELFTVSGEKEFDEECDIGIFGGCSRGQPQKSFKIKARNKYGDNMFKRELFPEKANDEYGGFILRNSGNDFNVTMFRDALMQQLLRDQMDIDYQAYKPAVLYLNGQYWGIQNMREKIDADFIESNYGLKKEQIDLLEGDAWAIEGSNTIYVNYLNQLEQMDRTTQQAFDYIDSQIDVQEFINYNVAQIYFANTDWPGNNIKFWREKSPTGKFRWLLFDTDFGFGLYSGASYATHPTLAFATDPNQSQWPNPAWSTRHLRLLLENPQFKDRFIQTFMTAIHTTFAPARVNQLISELQQLLEAEMIRHKTRWGGNISGWNWEVQRLRDFALQRNDFMKQYVPDFFNITDQVALTVNMNVPGGGLFKINELASTASENSISLVKGLPWKVSFTPYAGYEFINWDVTEQPVSIQLLLPAGNSWRFQDAGVFPGTNWTEPAYDDSGWTEGNAQLGYGDGDEQTVLDYGGDSENKHITYYFRKKINIGNPSELAENVVASILVDDGARVYINGTEVFNINLPSGIINNSTPALNANANENVFQDFQINKNAFITGENIIAVEVHQVSPTSSDISFDLILKSIVTGTEQNYQTTALELSGIAGGDITLTANMEKLPEVSGVVINEVNANKSIVDETGEPTDWLELYNTTEQDIDLNGLYLTDDLQNPTKHKIGGEASDPLLIKAHDYLVFYADDDIQDGPLHLNFKISDDGEELGLFQVIGENALAVDSYQFGYQPQSYSFSRIPNGIGDFTLTRTQTPGSENILNAEGSDVITVFPNPAANTFRINSIEPVTRVVVLDPVGRELRTFETTITDQGLSLNGLRDGVLLVRITTQKGSITTIKLVKNN